MEQDYSNLAAVLNPYDPRNNQLEDEMHLLTAEKQHVEVYICVTILKFHRGVNSRIYLPCAP